MAMQFTPSWINAIDESMSKWLNEYTCPGFMCIHHKPWKFSNEYHDAGCAMSDVIWQLDLCEGKDCPQHMGKKEYDKLGASVGTLLRLTKPVHGSGKVFVLDSGFYVLKALVELKRKGFFLPMCSSRIIAIGQGMFQETILSCISQMTKWERQMQSKEC